MELAWQLLQKSTLRLCPWKCIAIEANALKAFNVLQGSHDKLSFKEIIRLEERDNAYDVCKHSIDYHKPIWYPPLPPE